MKEPKTTIHTAMVEVVCVGTKSCGKGKCRYYCGAMCYLVPLADSCVGGVFVRYGERTEECVAAVRRAGKERRR